MTLPPRWLRRCLVPPLLLASLIVSLVVLAVSVLPLTLLSIGWRTARRLLRLVVFAPVVLGVETAAVVAAFGLWVGRGSAAAHYRVLGGCLHLLVRAASVLLALRPEPEVQSWPADRLARSDRPLLVLCRHAGPGDSLVVLDALITHYGLRPRLVMKEAVRLDPVVDVYFQRLPAAFISPQRAGEPSPEDAIRCQARQLGSGDTLVMFPEGANYTPRRRRRSVRRLAERGDHAAAARARRLRHLLPPRPGGVLAVLDEAAADVLVVGHIGFGDIHSIADAWRSLDRPKQVALKAWFTAAEDIPSERNRRTDWLYGRWSTVDDWVASEAETEPTASTSE